MTGESSYVHGAADVPLLGEAVGAHFARSAARWADRTALVVREQNVRWSYAELDARVDAFAAGLLALGLEPGDIHLNISSPGWAKHWYYCQSTRFFSWCFRYQRIDQGGSICSFL